MQVVWLGTKQQQLDKIVIKDVPLQLSTSTILTVAESARDLGASLSTVNCQWKRMLARSDAAATTVSAMTSPSSDTVALNSCCQDCSWCVCARSTNTTIDCDSTAADRTTQPRHLWPVHGAVITSCRQLHCCQWGRQYCCPGVPVSSWPGTVVPGRLLSARLRSPSTPTPLIRLTDVTVTCALPSTMNTVSYTHLTLPTIYSV